MSVVKMLLLLKYTGGWSVGP